MNKNKKTTFYQYFVIFMVILIISITIINKESKIAQQKNNDIYSKNVETDSYILSSEYYDFVINNLQIINNNNIFSIGSLGTRFQYLQFSIYSKNRMTYNDFAVQSEELTKKLYEKIKDKTIKKDGFLSQKYFIINLCFYEKFNDNLNPKHQNYNLVGAFQIDTKDLEKYRSYTNCVTGGISELEWKQEKK